MFRFVLMHPFLAPLCGLFGLYLAHRILHGPTDHEPRMSRSEIARIQAEMDATADAWHQKHDPPGVYAASQRGKREGRRLAGLRD